MNLKRINDNVIIDIDEIISVERAAYKKPTVSILFKKRKEYEHFECSMDEIEKAIKG